MKIDSLVRKFKSKEFRDYLIWGVISAVVNIGIFRILVLIGIDYRMSNIVALLINRIFCYITNKLFVFRTRCKNILLLLYEFLVFMTARMITFFLDYFGVIILVEFMKLDSTVSKIITSVLVIISNYTFSKLYVFKNRG